VLKTNEIGSTGLQVTKLGIGSAPLGGLFSHVDPDDAVDTVQASVHMGINYIDTAPLYGHGKSEELVGKAVSTLSGKNIAISTKVGRILENTDSPPISEHFVNLPPKQPVYDYSRDGTLRSLEHSLERLKLSRVDLLYIHDPDEGNSLYNLYDAPNHYKQVMDETLPTLMELKYSKTIKAIGVGMNGCPMLTQFAQHGEFDCFLVAGRYTLLDQSAMDELLPLCEKKNISIVIGGPYNSGILASDLSPNSTFFYEKVPQNILERAKAIQRVCDRYNVPLKAAALQFCFTHPSVSSVIPGARSVDEIKENFEMSQHPIPKDLWSELSSSGLIRPDIGF